MNENDIAICCIDGKQQRVMVSTPPYRCNAGDYVEIEIMGRSALLSTIYVLRIPSKETIQAMQLISEDTVIPAKRIYAQAWECDF